MQRIVIRLSRQVKRQFRRTISRIKDAKLKTRYLIILHTAQGYSRRQIAKMLLCSSSVATPYPFSGPELAHIAFKLSSTRSPRHIRVKHRWILSQSRRLFLTDTKHRQLDNTAFGLLSAIQVLYHVWTPVAR